MTRPLRVISGGQTGVDRAALDAALAAGIEVGGWCPHGRKAEDGVIAARYPLQETLTARYSERTRLNVRDADGTLILADGPLTGGTALTRAAARSRGCPLLVIQRADAPIAEVALRIGRWIEDYGIQVLNVAGPRESTAPGIAAWVVELLLLAWGCSGTEARRGSRR